MNRHHVFLAIAFVSASVVRLMGFAGGYLVQPAPLGALTPYLLLPLAFVPVATLLVYLVSLLRGVRELRRWALLVLAVLPVCLVLPNPLLPNGFDGFILRMRGVPDAEFHRLAEDVRGYLSSKSLTEALALEHQEVIYTFLRDAHPLLDISSWKPYLFARGSVVTITWGSGLTGGYEAIVVDDVQPPQWVEPDRLTQLYDRVYLTVP